MAEAAGDEDASRLELFAVEVVFGQLSLLPEVEALLPTRDQQSDEELLISFRFLDFAPVSVRIAPSRIAAYGRIQVGPLMSERERERERRRRKGERSAVTVLLPTLLPSPFSPTPTAREPHRPLPRLLSHSHRPLHLPHPPPQIQRGRSCLFPAAPQLLAQRLAAAPIYVSLVLRRPQPLEDVLIAGAALPLDPEADKERGAGAHVGAARVHDYNHGPALLRLVNLRGDDVAVVAVRVGIKSLGAAALRHFAGRGGASSGGDRWQPIPAMAREAWLRALHGAEAPHRQWLTRALLAEEEENAPPPLVYTKAGQAPARPPPAEKRRAASVARERAAIDRLLQRAPPAGEEGEDAWVQPLAEVSAPPTHTGHFDLLQALQAQLAQLLAAAVPPQAAPAPVVSPQQPHGAVPAVPPHLNVNVSFESDASEPVVDTQHETAATPPPRPRWRPSTLADEREAEARLADLQARWNDRLSHSQRSAARLSRGERSSVDARPASLLGPRQKVGRQR